MQEEVEEREMQEKMEVNLHALDLQQPEEEEEDLVEKTKPEEEEVWEDLLKGNLDNLGTKAAAIPPTETAAQVADQAVAAGGNKGTEETRRKQAVAVAVLGSMIDQIHYLGLEEVDVLVT